MIQHSVPNLRGIYWFASVSVTEVCTEIQSYTLYIGCVLQVIILKCQLQKIWKFPK
jgi:hypothetical protein